MASVRMSSPRTREPKKPTRLERTKVKVRPPALLQSVKSLPLDYRFTAGSPSSADSNRAEYGLGNLNEKEKKEKFTGEAKAEDDSPFSSKSSSGEDRPSGVAEDFDDAEENEESPYSTKTTSREERAAEGDEGDVRTSSSATSKISAIPLSRSDSNWGDTRSYVAKKKLQAWCQHSNGDWVLATIISSSGPESVISLPNGDLLRFSTESLLPSNPEILDGVDDLMQLSYLHEPSVLHNLNFRYS